MRTNWHIVLRNPELKRLLELLSRLPLWLLYRKAQIAGFLLFHVVRYRRNLVQENLSLAFPEKSQKQIRVLARTFYRDFTEFAVEAIKGFQMSGADFEKRVEILNAEVLKPYIEAGQPVLLVGAHQANWEWALLACAHRLPFPLDAIYKPVGHQGVDEFLFESRHRFGITPVPADRAIAGIIKKRRSMRGITLIADQNPERKEERYWTTFFGRETPFALGCEKIAQITRFPVIFTHRKRLARGYYQIRFSLLAEPPYAKGADSVVEEYVRELERSIAEQPENWLWTYDRWRHKRPLYAQGGASK